MSIWKIRDMGSMNKGDNTFNSLQIKDYSQNYSQTSPLYFFKFRFAAASFGCLLLICQLHIIAELVHHLYKGLIDDLLPALGNAVHLCVSKHTVSQWHESMKWIVFSRACSQNHGQEHICYFPVRQEHIHRLLIPDRLWERVDRLVFPDNHLLIVWSRTHALPIHSLYSAHAQRFTEEHFV